MKILIACEESATVRDAFRAAGHDAWSCDILPSRGNPRWHIQGDVIPRLGDGWDMSERSKTFPGLARAMVEQWGNLPAADAA